MQESESMIFTMRSGSRSKDQKLSERINRLLTHSRWPGIVKSVDTRGGKHPQVSPRFGAFIGG